MIVVESGGTKSTWIYKGPKGETVELSTVGLHPQELNEDKSKIIKELVDSNHLKGETIYFYGGGCESLPARQKVKDYLTQFDLDVVQVETDIYAACIAHLNDNEGVVGIIGTGAVAAKFDGEKVLKITSGWGYLLGDEGSGFDIGKRLLQAYLRKELSESIAKDIEEYFDGAPILHRVYEADGRRFVAGLTHIVHKHRDNQNIKTILTNCFDDFCETALKPLVVRGPIHFIGSVAYYFKEELEDSLNKYHFHLGNLKKEAGPAIFDYLSKRTIF